MNDAHEIRLEPDLTWVRLAGEVDAAMTGLMDLVPVAIEAGRPVVVDVAQVTFMDSTGCGFLASLVVGLRPQRVTVTGANAELRRLLQRLRLDSVLNLVNDRSGTARSR